MPSSPKKIPAKKKPAKESPAKSSSKKMATTSDKIVKKKKVSVSKHDKELYNSILALHGDSVHTHQPSSTDQEKYNNDYEKEPLPYKERENTYSRIYNSSLRYSDTVRNSKTVQSSKELVRYIATKNPLSKVKHHTITQGMIVITALVLIATYISPKSSAESVIFYPTSCLGGWNNVTHAEGVMDVEGNINETSFTATNSAVLPTGVSADVYCGGFTGEFKENTKPTKIILAISWSKGEKVLIEATSTASTTVAITSESFASSSLEILDSASSSVVSFTLATTTPEELPIASSTNNDSSESTILPLLNETTEEIVSTTTPSITPSQDQPIIVTPPVETESTPSLTPQPAPPTGETPLTPVSQEDTTTPPNPIVSFLGTFLQLFRGAFGEYAYAEEPEVEQTEISSPPTVTPIIATSENNQPQIIDSITGATIPNTEISSSSPTTQIETTPLNQGLLERITDSIQTQVQLPDLFSAIASSSEMIIPASTSTFTYDASSSFDILSSTMLSTSSIITDSNSSSTYLTSDQSQEDEAQNNFLEILYTYDGVTWKSLGKVNEDSLVYRTFEIPVTATTAWDDLSQLQIQIRPFPRIDETPTIYLDGMKLDVIYETPVEHEHPDFTRDTILKDKSDDNVRVVSIINADTNNKEIWYTTITTQGEFGIAPGTWVRLDIDQARTSYRLVEIYGRYLFWVDDIGKMLWTTNLEKNVNEGVALIQQGTTTVPFVKSNGELWYFDYNALTKQGVLRIEK